MQTEPNPLWDFKQSDGSERLCIESATKTTYNSANLPTAGNARCNAFGNTSGGLPTPYTEHYSLDTEYQISDSQFVASLGYQGSSSHHLNTNSNAMATALVRGVALNPLITAINYYPNDASSNNNAFLAELKHPMLHHFQLDAQFMWAKSMDNGFWTVRGGSVLSR